MKLFKLWFFLFVCLILVVCKAIAWNIDYLIFKYPNKIYHKDNY